MDKHCNLNISNFRFAILTSCPTALLGRAAFAAYERFAVGKTSADCARKRVSERNRREAAALGAEMGGETQNERTSSRMSFRFGGRYRARTCDLSRTLKGAWSFFQLFFSALWPYLLQSVCFLSLFTRKVSACSAALCGRLCCHTVGRVDFHDLTVCTNVVRLRFS